MSGKAAGLTGTAGGQADGAMVMTLAVPAFFARPGGEVTASR